MREYLKNRKIMHGINIYVRINNLQSHRGVIYESTSTGSIGLHLFLSLAFILNGTHFSTDFLLT